MTKEEAIVQLEWYFEKDNGISADLVTKQAFNTIKMEEIKEKEKIERDPCETCGYAEGSPFCLQYCPYDAEIKKEQEPTEKPMTVDEMEREYEKSKALFHKIVEREDAISREAVFNAIEREDKWLLAAKGHNGLTEIAFSGLKGRIDALPSVSTTKNIVNHGTMNITL